MVTKAANELLKDRRADEMIGVFVIDRALRTMQSTRPTARSSRRASTGPQAPRRRFPAGAVADGATRGRWSDRPGRRGRRVRREPAGHGDGAPTPAEAGASADSAAQEPRGEAAAFQAALDRMDRNYRDLQTETEGHASMDALLALVDSLGALPAERLVFFSEGLSVPAAIEAKFRAVIETANRSNVSFYTVDAKGLKVHSEQAATKNQLDDITKATVAGAERSNNGKWSEDLERNETLLKSDPAAALGILTTQTGGLLIQNTNDP